jgi:carboxylate-amine ligase
LLLETGSLDEASHIWWDVRPSEKFPTLEVRIPDSCTRLEETLCIAALVQAIVAKLVQLRRANQSWRSFRKNLIDENKWRAVRYGVTGKLIDFGRAREVPFSQLAGELVAFVDDVVDDLGSRAEVEYVDTILSQGCSADRQLDCYHRDGDFRSVVEHVVQETAEGLA